MATVIWDLHPTHPQQRLINQIAQVIEEGGVIVYPTDSLFALGCALGERKAIERIRQIRQLEKRHNFTLICQDLATVAQYAKIDNQQFRLLKASTPGPYTFILEALKRVPKQLQHPKKKTIGIRIPEHAMTQAILSTLQQPMMSVSLLMPGDEFPETDSHELIERLENLVDLIIVGESGLEPTSVIDMTTLPYEVLREGKGELGLFQD